MPPLQQKFDARRTGFSSLSAVSLFLAAVIVLTTTPAMLAGSLADPSDQMARVGSQLRRLAAAVPVRLVSKAPKRDQHKPVAELNNGSRETSEMTGASIAIAIRFDGPAIAPLLAHYMDLPPPAVAV